MLSLILACLMLNSALAADPESASTKVEESNEPIRYFQRYKPSYFLMGKPNTKVNISFKVQILREVPLFFGYSQLMIWDLFKTSAPVRDINFDPELFYRLKLGGEVGNSRELDLGILEHESNGRDGPESRSWNRAYLRYTSSRLLPSKGLWWSMKLALPYGMGEPESKDIPRRRGIWEFQLGITDLFDRIFDVNELVLRVYGGGGTRLNPLQGGQELTYREKNSRRVLLLPLYFQIFHGYGENLLDGKERHWGFRAGVGF